VALKKLAKRTTHFRVRTFIWNGIRLVILGYYELMRTVKISELKDKLSAYIRFVKNGEEVLILERNTPVARLVGYELPKPAGDRIIPQEVMDQIWEEERADRR
jgi:prevent-host-death family protein